MSAPMLVLHASHLGHAARLQTRAVQPGFETTCGEFYVHESEPILATASRLPT
jgi:hypothetical protein